ncbi:MAG: flippase-like domain-containing protein [Firmicutes bacterium]|nr:flippase-like domain-containing protein [Bacillota bacterium]
MPSVRRNLLVATLLTIVTLAALLGLTWRPESWRHLTALRPLTIAVSLALVAGTWAVGGLRTWALARALGYRPSLLTSLRASLVGTMTSGLTPFSSGGGPAEAAVLSKEASLPYSVAMAAVTATGIVNQSVLLLVSAAVLFSPLPLPGLPAVRAALRWAILVYAAGLVGVVAALLRLQWLAGPVEAILTRVGRGMPRVAARARAARIKTRRFLIGMADALRTVLQSRPAAILAVGAVYLVYYVLLFAVGALLAASLGAEIPAPVLVLAQFPLLLLGGLIPTPGASGGLEAAMAAMVAPHLPDGAGGIFVGAWRLLTFYTTLVAGLVATGLSLRPRTGRSQHTPRPVREG